MKIVAVANQKGGVGKTTTVYHLALAAEAAGLRTLVVDADPQGNITRALAIEDIDPNSVSLADVLAPQTSVALEDVVAETAWEKVTLVPAGGDKLASVEQSLTGQLGRESRLRQILSPAADSYDLVLIDCNPSISVLTTNALVAAHGVLIVSRADMWSLDGLGRLFTSINATREHYNKNLQLLGVLVNQHEQRTNQARYWLSQLQEQTREAGIRLLDPVIPKRQIISDAPESGARLEEFGSAGRELAAIYSTHLHTLMKENH